MTTTSSISSRREARMAFGRSLRRALVSPTREAAPVARPAEAPRDTLRQGLPEDATDA